MQRLQVPGGEAELDCQSGGFDIVEARTLDDLAAEREATGSIAVMSLADAAASAFPILSVCAADAASVRNGRPIDLTRVWTPFREIAVSEASALVADGG